MYPPRFGCTWIFSGTGQSVDVDTFPLNCGLNVDLTYQLTVFTFSFTWFRFETRQYLNDATELSTKHYPCKVMFS